MKAQDPFSFEQDKGVTRGRLDALVWLIGLVLLLLAWQYFAQSLGFFISSPRKIAASFLAHYQALGYHALVTLFELLMGLALGVCIGGLIGILMAYLPFAERMGLPLLVASQALPVFAIAPLLVFWFGFGLAPRIIMACLIVFFPMALGMLLGLKQAKARAKDLLRCYQPHAWAAFWHVYLPYAVPALTQALRVSVASAPIAVLVGEWIGGASGIGWLLLHARARFDMALMMAALLVIFVLAVILYALNQRLCRALERRFM